MQRQMTGSFEETYPRYPFAPLVAGALRIGAALARWRRQRHGGIRAPRHAGAADAAGRA